MKRAILSACTGALFMFTVCAIETEAFASENGSWQICTTFLAVPFFATQSLSVEINQSSQNSSHEPSGQSSDSSQDARTPSGKSSESSRGTIDDSRADSRASSASSSSEKAPAPRKLIVPWRARSEAASFLAGSEKAPPSTLLRSILIELRQQQREAGTAALSDRALAAQLVATPIDQS